MSPLLQSIHTSIQTHGIKRQAEHQLISTKGGALSWLIDMREVFLRPNDLNTIAALFWEKYQHKMPFQIGGMEVAAVPLVTAILLKAAELNIPASGFIIRKERKKTGMGKNIEGALTAHPVILVDDLMNSGSSIEKSRAIINAEGLNLAEVFVVIDYQSPTGLNWRDEHNITVTSLFTLKDFPEVKLSAPAKAPATRQFYTPLWRFAVEGAYPFYVNPKSTPLLYEGKLFMGSDKASFHAVDAATGRNLWHVAAPNATRKGIWSSPAAHNGKVYFGSYNGNLYCVDTNTGEVLWEQHLCEWIGSSPLILPHHNLLTIGLEYANPKWGGSVAAYNLDTGERVWESLLRVVQHGSASHYAKQDLVIYGTNDHTIVAYRADNGQKVWEFPTIRSIKYAPAISEELEIAAAASSDGNIYLLDANTGQLKAAIPTENLCYTTPLIVGNRLFAGSTDRHLYVIDLTTLSLIKRLDFSARIFSSPRLIPPGNVIFGTCGGKIIELNPTTLEITGRHQLPDAITNAITFTADGSTVYAPTYMNEIFALQRQTLTSKPATPLP